MTVGRNTAFAALSVLALGLAATTGLPLGGDKPTAAACSSCDARHQSHLRLMAKRSAEITP
jgi:hypothetical protein